MKIGRSLLLIRTLKTKRMSGDGGCGGTTMSKERNAEKVYFDGELMSVVGQ